MNNYIFVGSVRYSAYCLQELLKLNINLQAIMCPDKEAAKFNSDYCDLAEVASNFGRDVHYFKRIKDEADFIKTKEPDIIFIFGLSQIVPKEILKIPKIGCIGSHPALLPQNRGRQAIVWAIANGLGKSGVSFFWMDEGVDSGDLWAQEPFDISLSDDAASVYKKVTELSIKILKENIPELEKGLIRKVRQDHTKANYWRKRNKEDGRIDWRMSTKRIYDLVRSLVRPYVGAHCIFQGQEYKVWKIAMRKGSKLHGNLEPGKVVSVNGNKITVKTGDELVDILEHEINPLPKIGDCL